MKSASSTHAGFDTTLELPQRIQLVMAVYEKFGYINRKSLMAFYGITQQQAGALMRDFIHAHASNLRWDITHCHYKFHKSL